MGKHGVVDASRVQLPYHCYMGGETITNPNNWKVPLPTQTTVVQIEAEDGECHYAIDGNFAQDNSPGYIAADAGAKIGPIGGGSMQTLHIHAPTGIIHLQYFQECGRGRNERAGFQYYEKVLNLDPIAYWPLWETAGTTAECLVNPAQNGTYTGVTLGQSGIGDGNTCPFFDGTNDYLNVQTATLQSAFNGLEGSMVWWMRVNAATDWDGAVQRYIGTFVDTTDWNELVQLYKPSANAFRFRYGAGGVTEDVDKAGITDAAWIHAAVTWSNSADEMKAYWNATQEGATQGTLGAWAGTLDRAVIGAGSTVPAAVWSGYIQHFAIFGRALPLTDIQNLYIV